MITVTLTKRNGQVERREFVEGIAAHDKELLYLMVSIATSNLYRYVTIDKGE